MTDEESNEPVYWKSRLDQLTQLPGEIPAGKEAAWDKLHVRLQKKPVRKKPVWYWAAACLLFASGMSWLMLQQIDIVPVKNTRVQIPAHSTRGRLLVTDSKDTIAVSAYLPKQTVHTLPVEPDKQIHPHVSTHAVVADAPVALYADTVKEQAHEIPVYAIRPADTMSTTALLPVQKKLRVVHINTLGSTEEGVQVAGNSSASYLQASHMVPDDQSRFSISRNSSDNIIKIKLSSSN